jgi:hypothetical protein
VFTVSEQFALDLKEEILHSKILAPHLTPILGNRLTGINNGLFADLSINQDALSTAANGDFSNLDAWKRLQRSQLSIPFDCNKILLIIQFGVMYRNLIKIIKSSSFSEVGTIAARKVTTWRVVLSHAF